MFQEVVRAFITLMDELQKKLLTNMQEVDQLLHLEFKQKNYRLSIATSAIVFRFGVIEIK